MARNAQLHGLSPSTGCSRLLFFLVDQPTILLRLRSLDDGIFIASRYFATVRRATVMPPSDSICAIWLSLSGFSGSSALTSLRIFARTAVDDCSPSSPATWLEKK